MGTDVRKLDFIIIGAEKSGTTTLVSLLNRSPAVSIPKREIRYFRDPFFPKEEHIPNLEPEQRHKLFGIKHPSYLGRPEVPKRIYEYNRNMKIVAILRNPVDRAISSYVHYLRHAQIPLIHPNVGLWNLVENPGLSPKYSDILEFGRYYKYLAMYRQYFPVEQMFITEYVSFFEDSGLRELHSLFDFLSIVPSDLSISSLDMNIYENLNKGVYEWGKLMDLYFHAQRRYRYDRMMNIIGQTDVDYTGSFPRNLRPHEGETGGIEIDRNVRSKLKELYAKDCEMLKREFGLAIEQWEIVD